MNRDIPPSPVDPGCKCGLSVSGLCCVIPFLLLTIIPCSAWAQSVSDSPPTALELLSPLRIGGDFVYVAKAPLRLQSEDYLEILGVAGLTAGVMSTLDRPMYRAFNGGRDGPPATPVPRHLSSLGRVYDHVGPNQFVLGTAGALAAGGLILDDSKLTRTSVRVVEAAVFTQVLTGVLKQAIGRSRPYLNEGPYNADLLEFEASPGARSMPSGHTSKIFAVASVIAHQYDSWWVKIPVYTVATSAGIQRIESGKHWFSDVALGAALGYFIGKALADRPERPNTVKGFSYDPVVTPNRVGLSIRF